MRIDRVQIQNYRNFRHLDVRLSDNAVIVGENKIGKTNFLNALRLVLDPSLPETSRQLDETDFWDGLANEPNSERRIVISVDLVDFEDDEDLLALLCPHLVSHTPMTCRLTFEFPSEQSSFGSDDGLDGADYSLYGGDRPDNRLRHEVRQRIPLDVLPALRDAEGDLANWRRSPLRPLLRRVQRNIDVSELSNIANNVHETTTLVVKQEPIQELITRMNERLLGILGPVHGIDTTLGFVPLDPQRMIRTIRLLIDDGKRGVSDGSLGIANVLLIALKLIEMELLNDEDSRDHTFLAIEEPEAHLHPHIQRLLYRDLLFERQPLSESQITPPSSSRSVFLTTHSPYIASVAPIRSIVLLRRSDDGRSTEAVSTACLDLTASDIDDLERYLDVKKGELLFARGVVLVEGDAEQYVVPVFARRLRYDLDRLGISICSVNGTNFVPYVKLLGSQGLNLPFVVLTDRDPQDNGPARSVNRVRTLLSIMGPDEQFQALTPTELLLAAQSAGIFVNEYTLEVDLYRTGCHEPIFETLEELHSTDMIKRRIAAWRKAPSDCPVPELLREINFVGKGRFAQRLAGKLTADHCPAYVREALGYVAQRCS